MNREQIAINSVSTVRAKLEDCLPAYAEAGFANVELTLDHAKAFLDAGHDLADVRRMLDDNRLRCIGGFGGAIRCFGPADQIAQSRDQLRRAAEMLAELGGTIMVTGTDGPAEPGGDPLGPIVDGFGEAADAAGEFGVTLCLEFNWSPIVKSIRTAADVARRSGRPNAGVLFDPAHYHCTPSKFEQLTAENVRVIRHVHVDDMQDKPGELSNCNSDRVLPGQGCLDLPALFARLEEHGYAGYYSIELFNEQLWSMPVRDAAKLMYQSMLTLL